MKTHKRPELSAEDQELLTGVKIRLIEKAEQVRFDALLEAEHYLHSAVLVGEQIRYVAEYKGQWVGLLAWSAAAYNLKGRESWIGWSRLQKRWRLGLVANNSRYLIRSEQRVPNLASRVMKLCLDRLSADWEQIQHCRNKRQATLRGFYDFMAGKNAKKAFSLVTVCKSSWLPP